MRSRPGKQELGAKLCPRALSLRGPVLASSSSGGRRGGPARGASGQSLVVPVARSSVCASTWPLTGTRSIWVTRPPPAFTGSMCSGSMSKGHGQGLGSRTSPPVSWGTHFNPEHTPVTIRRPQPRLGRSKAAADATRGSHCRPSASLPLCCPPTRPRTFPKERPGGALTLALSIPVRERLKRPSSVHERLKRPSPVHERLKRPSSVHERLKRPSDVVLRALK